MPERPAPERPAPERPTRYQGFDLVGWFAARRRAEAAPGVYALGPEPRRRRGASGAGGGSGRAAGKGAPGADHILPGDPAAEVEDDRPPLPAWRLLLRAALNLVVAWVVLLYGGSVLIYLVLSIVPGGGSGGALHTVVLLLAYLVVIGVLVKVFGRMGRWPLVYRRFLRPLLARLVTHDQPEQASVPSQGAARRPDGVVPRPPQSAPHVSADPWEALRPAVPAEALALLDAETAAQRVMDVDHTRLHRAWRSAVAAPGRFAGFVEELRRAGAAAFAHPSGARDLPHRSPTGHDLLRAQVRLGEAPDVPRNPSEYRGVEVALDPSLLGTSLLAVGPAATGKTAGLTRPVAESLCLQALCGTAVTVVVGAADAELGPDSWYDVVIAPGDPARGRYGLDLYGASGVLDEAAARLADALLPEELALRAEGARGTVRTVLAAFRAGYGRNPGVRELCALLRGEPADWEELRGTLAAAGKLTAHQRELEARERQHGRADDLGALLADRLALLDRPGLADSFNPSAEPADPSDPAESAEPSDAAQPLEDRKPPAAATASASASAAAPAPVLPLFALRALEHPLRVRIALPEAAYPEAARIVSRLAVGQFLHAAAARRDRSLFAGLVVDDASAAVDSHAVRGLQRIRGANAGAVLALRSLSDLPESLRNPLFGAVGCRMAFPGLAPWDGRLFSEAWGTVWVNERDVTRTPDLSGGMLRRLFRSIRSVLEGERVQTESVTTRRVERQRWSPSDLAHALPSGHAVLSLGTVAGATVPPVFLQLGGGSATGYANAPEAAR
ncbi:hypothetical protein [Phaeacidiphilus oryzae]|uniref:hypothetical protein n=1 Tax=Phaeacidiphilus oryzae TaxID=348818 RepID=UPI00068A6E37|nr:hypothetical protein [Phaeacidiphilus oryzae]